MINRVKVGDFADLREGVGLKVEVDEHRIAVFLVDGSVFAIGDRCSHAEASLAEGEVFGLEVECPRHGSTFDLTTGYPQSLPATQPVPTYVVSIEEGNVYVDIPE